MNMLSSNFLIFLIVLFLAASTERTAAQQPKVAVEKTSDQTDPPQGAEKKEPESRRRSEHASGGSLMRNLKRGYRGPLMNFYEYDMTERKRLREALQAVLDDPAVAQARDNLRGASEHLKSTLRSAIAKKDPQLAPMLADMLKKNPPGRPMQYPGAHAKRGPGGQRQAGSGRDTFAGNPAEFLQGEVLRRALEARRRDLWEAHDAVMKNPDIQATIRELSKTQPGSPEKQDLRDTLRQSYLAEMEKFVPGVVQLLQPEARPRTTTEHNTDPGQQSTDAPSASD